MNNRKAKKIRKEAQKVSKAAFVEFLRRIHELSFLERLIIAWKVIRKPKKKKG